MLLMSVPLPRTVKEWLEKQDLGQSELIEALKHNPEAFRTVKADRGQSIIDAESGVIRRRINPYTTGPGFNRLVDLQAKL